MFNFTMGVTQRESIRIRRFSGPYFSAFVLNTKRYGRTRPECEVAFRIQAECGKIRTRKTPNTDTSQAVLHNRDLEDSILNEDIIT